MNEYLALERAASTKSEYFDGEIFAMAGASREHNQISTNTVRVLANQLLDKLCNVYASDMKVKIDKVKKYTYPDIVIACEQEKFEDEKKDILLNPIVIIEILSASTEAYGRGQKFFHYQFIASLVQYILISQSTFRVESFVRQRNGSWLYLEFHDISDLVELKAIECTLPIKEVYRKIDLGV